MTCPRIEVICAVCGRRAATMELLLPGVTHAKAGSTAIADLGTYDRFDGGSFIVDGVVGKAAYSLAQVRNAIQLEQLQEIFLRGTWRALYHVNPEWLPSYCPACDVNYCGEHWNKSVELDEGFYDCTRGTCPRGHARILDD